MTDYKEWEREMSADFHGMMDGIRSESVPEDSLRRSLEAAEAIQMTGAAYKRGLINAIMVTVVMFLVLCPFAFGVSKYFDLPMSLAVMGVTGALSVFAFPWAVGVKMLGRLYAGKVLLDCGPHPTRKRFLAMTVPMFIGAAVTLVVSTSIFAILVASWLVAYGLFWIFLSTGRLQICENGVFQYWSLLPWHKIESFHWQGDEDATLMLQAKSRFAFTGRGALPVAIEQKKEVDILLAKHLK